MDSGNTSYNPASRAAAGAILPSRSVRGYYSSLLPESVAALQYILKKSLPGCELVSVASNMSDAALQTCWAAFKHDLAASGEEFNSTKATPLRAAFPAAGYLNEGDWFEKDWQAVFWGRETYVRASPRVSPRRRVSPRF